MPRDYDPQIIRELSPSKPPATPASDPVNHPAHYGAADNPYEVIKVINAWGLDFSLGNTIKYIARAGKKTTESIIQDLKKARFYLDNKIAVLEATETPHASSASRDMNWPNIKGMNHPICINCSHTHYYESGDKLPMGKCRNGCECSNPQYPAT